MENNWISVTNNNKLACCVFYKEFHLDEVSNALLDITAIGLYKVFINKKEANYLAPLDALSMYF